MRLTDYTDYSLRALIYVAVHPDELVTIQQIADTFTIPKNHLVKIVQHLGQAGYLHTLRGRGGGLRLGRPAVEINIGDVIRTMEPDFGLVECFRPNSQCLLSKACGLRGLLAEALQAYFNVLNQYNLQDLVDSADVKNGLAQGDILHVISLSPRSSAASASGTGSKH